MRMRKEQKTYSRKQWTKLSMFVEINGHSDPRSPMNHQKD
jgi:hypothetical protein